MSFTPIQTARVSDYLRTTLGLSSISRTQRNLLTVQNQISTGRKFSAASDDPGNAAIAIRLQRTLERSTSYADAVKAADSELSLADSTLGDVTDLLRQASQLASANVGSDVTAEQRQSAAAVARSIYSQLLSLAGTQSNGRYLFAGDRGTSPAFVEAGGGVRYDGTGRTLSNAVDEHTTLSFGVDGGVVFGGTSAPTGPGANLFPTLTGATRLSDLRGATGYGIRLGSIAISDGTSTRSINLGAAASVQDLLDAINSTGLTTATINGGAISLSAGAGQDLTVTEIGSGTTAADLGLLRTTGAGAGVSLVGQSTAPRLTQFTPLSALLGGAGLATAGGLQITTGVTVNTIDLSAASTVGDVLNAINGGQSGARASINAAGNGIEIVGTTQGLPVRVAENGGTVAAALGVRSFAPGTVLSSLNGGKGLTLAPGTDLQIVDRGGTVYDVDLNSATTVNDVLNLINTATGGAVVASFATTGNGIILTDTTGGAGSLTVRPANASNAAASLGILSTTPGAVLTGSDPFSVETPGVFGNLLKLISGLQSSDANTITAAGSGLATDLTRVAGQRGETGARVKELEGRAERLDSQDLTTKSLLSQVADTDFTEAIGRFQLLQTALQANYSTQGRTLSISLLDYLR